LRRGEGPTEKEDDREFMALHAEETRPCFNSFQTMQPARICTSPLLHLIFRLSNFLSPSSLKSVQETAHVRFDVLKPSAVGKDHAFSGQVPRRRLEPAPPQSPKLRLV
jgi:hypothetical protein